MDVLIDVVPLNRRCRVRDEYAAGADVARFERHQLGRADRALSLKEPFACRSRARSNALRSERALAKLGCCAPQRDVVAQRLARAVAQRVLRVAGELLGDLQQLVIRVVRKVDVMRDARAEAGVRLEERVHAVRCIRRGSR